jgi:hypothetical protein
MAETEFSVLTTHCLARRRSAATTLRQEVAAWEQRRNHVQSIVNWRFTAQDVRINLK